MELYGPGGEGQRGGGRGQGWWSGRERGGGSPISCILEEMKTISSKFNTFS